MNSIDIYNLYIKYLKESIKLTTNKPSFKEDFTSYKHANCYAYALGIKSDKLANLLLNLYHKKEIEPFFYNSGFTMPLEERCKILPTKRNLIEELSFIEKDFENLNIKAYETTIHSDNKHNGYKISFYKANDDFHFIRQKHRWNMVS